LNQPRSRSPAAGEHSPVKLRNITSSQEECVTTAMCCSGRAISLQRSAAPGVRAALQFSAQSAPAQELGGALRQLLVRLAPLRLPQLVLRRRVSDSAKRCRQPPVRASSVSHCDQSSAGKAAR